MEDINKINSNLKKTTHANSYRNNFKLIFLLIIPVILIFLFIKLNAVRGNYYLGNNSDPEYAYLLNSLKISELKSPSHFDHPGTTLQILGGFVIKIFNINKSSNDIRIDVFTNSERYLLYINILLLSIIITFTLLLGIYTYKITNYIWFGVILQLSVLCSSNIYIELSRVRPEPLLISALLVFIMIIISLLKNNLSQKITNYIIAFSLISGFALATKITFFPILIFPLIVLPKLKNKLYYVIGTIMSLILFTLPITNHYEQFFVWIKKLFIHSGHYGNGGSTIINPSTYLNNIISALSSNIIFTFVLSASIIIILTHLLLFKKHTETKHTIEFKILVSIIITQIIQVLFVSKHYSAHYLIPSLMLTGVAIVFLIINVRQIFNLKINNRFYSAIILLAILFSYYTVNSFFTISSSIEKETENQLSVINFVANNYKNYAKIYYYRSSSHEYALKFGNDFSGNEYSMILNKCYPSNYFYNIWDKRYYNFNESVDINSIINKNSNVLYEGTSFEKGYANTNYKPSVSLDNIFNGNSETIYLLKK